MQKLIKTVLENPQYIPLLLDSGILDKETSNKLSRVESVYSKTKNIPWKMLKNEFDNIELETADMEYFNQTLEEDGLFNFNMAVKEKTDKGFITPDEISELEEKYIKKFTEVTSTEFEIGDVKRDLRILAQKKHEQKEQVIKTHFSNFDIGLGGGMRAGGIYCFMGPTGTFKSTFLTNFTRSIWENGKNVLYISTEMNHIDTHERIFCSYTNQTDLDKATIWASNKSNLPVSKVKVVKVHPYDTKPMDFIKIIQDIEWKPDLIVVDYADELLPDKAADKEYDGQGIIYAGLKTIAEMFEVPIMTATQTNRESLNKEGGDTKDHYGLEAISDSSKKARLVDGLFSIIRTTHDKEVNELHLQTVKSRFSGHAYMDFVINPGCWRIDQNLGYNSKEDDKVKKEVKKQEEYKYKYIDKDIYEQVKYFNLYKDLKYSEYFPELKEKKRLKHIDDVDFKKIKEELTCYNQRLKDVDIEDLQTQLSDEITKKFDRKGNR